MSNSNIDTQKVTEILNELQNKASVLSQKISSLKASSSGIRNCANKLNSYNGKRITGSSTTITKQMPSSYDVGLYKIWKIANITGADEILSVLDTIDKRIQEFEDALAQVSSFVQETSTINECMACEIATIGGLISINPDEDMLRDSGLTTKSAEDEYSALSGNYTGISDENIQWWTDGPIKFVQVTTEDGQIAYRIDQQDESGNWIPMKFTDAATAYSYLNLAKAKQKDEMRKDGSTDEARERQKDINKKNTWKENYEKNSIPSAVLNGVAIGIVNQRQKQEKNWMNSLEQGETYNPSSVNGQAIQDIHQKQKQQQNWMNSLEQGENYNPASVNGQTIQDIHQKQKQKQEDNWSNSLEQGETYNSSSVNGQAIQDIHQKQKQQQNWMNSLEQGETYNPSSVNGQTIQDIHQKQKQQQIKNYNPSVANGQAIITNQENLKKSDEITKNLKRAYPDITQDEMDEIDEITKNLKRAYPNITQDEINKKIESLYGFNISS